MEKDKFRGSFKMKPLPKGEYQLLRALQEYHGINDPSDFFTILLRVAYELHHAQTFKWLEAEIVKWRDNPDEERTYEL